MPTASKGFLERLRKALQNRLCLGCASSTSGELRMQVRITVLIMSSLLTILRPAYPQPGIRDPFRASLA